jgi:hypothetical protein
VKKILSRFSYPYNRRIAGARGYFTKKDFQNWIRKSETKEFANALVRLAQLNQTKVYLFWTQPNRQTKQSILEQRCYSKLKGDKLLLSDFFTLCLDYSILYSKIED